MHRIFAIHGRIRRKSLLPGTDVQLSFETRIGLREIQVIRQQQKRTEIIIFTNTRGVLRRQMFRSKERTALYTMAAEVTATYGGYYQPLRCWIELYNDYIRREILERDMATQYLADLGNSTDSTNVYRHLIDCMETE